jgi:phenylpyruvate tautomerase PptA (4-oxalocrotonate tautomerase family)
MTTIIATKEATMPMIDVTAATGTFADKRALTKNLAAAMMRWEKVPPIALFRENTAAFIHELGSDSLSNAAGDSNYVRVEVLTPVGVLDRDKKLGVVKEMTEIIAAAAGDPSLASRTWVLISEAPDGGWGIDGHAYTNAEIADAARREFAGR